MTQLEELLAVRHSVFIVGGPGTGKSQVSYCLTIISVKPHTCHMFSGPLFITGSLNHCTAIILLTLVLFCLKDYPQLLLQFEKEIFVMVFHQILKTLHRTYTNMKMKPVWSDINPKAVTTDELFGYLHPATREWKDGEGFENLMKSLVWCKR